MPVVREDSGNEHLASDLSLGEALPNSCRHIIVSPNCMSILAVVSTALF